MYALVNPELKIIKKLRSRYCTIDATKLATDRYEASCGLFATTELVYLVDICDPTSDTCVSVGIKPMSSQCELSA